MRASNDRRARGWTCNERFGARVVRKERTPGPRTVVYPRPAVLLADVARPDHETDRVLEGLRYMAHVTLGTMKRRVRKFRYEPLEMRDGGKGLKELPCVNVHLCNEGAAHGPRPLACIIVREPGVGWVLRIRAREAKKLRGGGKWGCTPNEGNVYMTSIGRGGKSPSSKPEAKAADGTIQPSLSSWCRYAHKSGWENPTACRRIREQENFCNATRGFE